MTELDAVPVFLSASFPSDDERGRRFPADPGFVGDAVAAVSTALLRSGARIICGGHPTITPLLLFICDQNDWHERLEIYQSELYRSRIPAETWRIAENGFGALHFTPSSGDEDADLAAMRIEMLDATQPRAAVFIGGMEGIEREWELAKERSIPCLPVTAAGGAAATLGEPELGDTESRLLLASRSFPIVGREIVRVIRDQLD
jgi:hypothetical protein